MLLLIIYLTNTFYTKNHLIGKEYIYEVIATCIA